MRVSIRPRMILALNLLVVGVALAVGYGASEVVARVIEKRLVADVVSSTAGLLSRMRVPLTDAMMEHLKQIHGADAVVTDPDGSVLGSSLPPPQARAFGARVVRRNRPGLVDLAGKAYHVGTARIVRPGGPGSADEEARLYLLVPQEQLRAAKADVTGRIAQITLAAIAVATLLAFILSMTLTRPVRRLAAQMDRLAVEAGAGRVPPPGAAPRRGPTELVRLAESFDHLLACLRDAQERAARSERLATLGKLAASVVHELQNPLSGIQMNLRVLQDTLRKAGIEDDSAEVIHREIERMDLFCQELMGLAAGGAEVQPMPRAAIEKLPRLRLDEAGRSVLDLLAGKLQHAGVRVSCDWAPDAPPVHADAGQIRQVILNLVLNACQAMGQGGDLRLSLAPAGPRAVRFSVGDTGPGVQAPRGQTIFEPFVSTRPGGAGLGLYVCGQIVTRHGGRIGYDSSPRGATFWFELPAAASSGPGAA